MVPTCSGRSHTSGRSPRTPPPHHRQAVFRLDRRRWIDSPLIAGVEARVASSPTLSPSRFDAVLCSSVSNSVAAPVEVALLYVCWQVHEATDSTGRRYCATRGGDQARTEE